MLVHKPSMAHWMRVYSSKPWGVEKCREEGGIPYVCLLNFRLYKSSYHCSVPTCNPISNAFFSAESQGKRGGSILAGPGMIREVCWATGGRQKRRAHQPQPNSPPYLLTVTSGERWVPSICLSLCFFLCMSLPPLSAPCLFLPPSLLLAVQTLTP